MKKDANEKAFDVLQRLGVILKEQREELKSVMEYCCEKDAMQAVRFCVSYTYYELIGQFDENYGAENDNSEMPQL